MEGRRSRAYTPQGAIDGHLATMGVAPTGASSATAAHHTLHEVCMPAHTVLSVLRCACAAAALVALALGLIGCAMVNRRYEGGVIGNQMDHQANELKQPR